MAKTTGNRQNAHEKLSSVSHRISVPASTHNSPGGDPQRCVGREPEIAVVPGLEEIAGDVIHARSQPQFFQPSSRQAGQTRQPSVTL